MSFFGMTVLDEYRRDLIVCFNLHAQLLEIVCFDFWGEITSDVFLISVGEFERDLSLGLLEMKS
jgi:hypothetical protein